jgi:hypothetical protein
MHRNYPKLHGKTAQVTVPAIKRIHKKAVQERTKRFRRHQDKSVLRRTVVLGEEIEFTKYVVPIKGAPVSLDSGSPFRHRTKAA